MEEKDWIMLLFPILCNGIILFVFTQFIEAKKKKKMQAQIIHQELTCECLKILYNILQIFCVEEKTNKLLLLNEKLPLLFNFFLKSKDRMQEYSKSFSRIEKTWDDVVRMLNNVQDNEDEVIKGESGMKISFLTNRLFDSLVETAQKCFSDIYYGGDYATCVEKIGF